MADARFLNNLKFYPKDEINAEMVDLLQPYFGFRYTLLIIIIIFINSQTSKQIKQVNFQPIYI